MNRTVLAMDAAGAACSAALWREGRVRARRLERMRRGQSERLVPMIQEVMSEAGSGYADLDVIAVTVGPGGFTGVRIGLATARGLALALGRPLVGISNFLALAAAARAEAPPDRLIAAMIDAKRRDLYVQVFTPELAPHGEPAAVLPESLEAFLPPGALVLVGDGVDQALGALAGGGRDLVVSAVPGVVDAAQVADLVGTGAVSGAASERPQPLYLRPPDVTLPERTAPARPS